MDNSCSGLSPASDDMAKNLSCLFPAAMFIKKDPLPSTQQGCGLLYGDRKRNGSQGRAHMRGHIVGAFGSMAKKRVALGNKAIKKAFHIAQHFRVVIFLNEQRSRSVTNVKREQTGLNPGGRNTGFNLCADIVKTSSRCLNRERCFMLSDRRVLRKVYGSPLFEAFPLKVPWHFPAFAFGGLG